MLVNTVTTISIGKPSSPVRTPYAIFAIGLDKLYAMPMGDDTLDSRCMAIDRYIDSNGWTWDSLIEESEKADTNIN